jgi:hypothetical protein
VVEVDEEDVIPLEDKVKFSKGVVIYCGDRYGAYNFLSRSKINWCSIHAVRNFP